MTAAARETVDLSYIAQSLGVSVRRLYRGRRWQTMIAREGMPRPVSAIGRPRFDKLAIDAWIGRDHPLAPRLPAANDTAPLTVPQTIDQERAYLRAVYGRSRAV